MKVCIIVDDYIPRSTKVTAKMMHELSIEFIKQGHIVTVITPDPMINESQEITQYDGVTVCKFRSGEIKNVSKARRLVNEFQLSSRAWKTYTNYFINNPHDLIVFWSPSIFWSGLVKKLKKIWDVPSYMLLRDFFPQWIIDNGIIKEQSVIAKFLRYYEELNYKAADMIALQSPKNIEWFSNFKGPNLPLDLLYNWASDIPVTNVGNVYRSKLGLGGKVVFFYGGNIGHAQDMMNVVRLAKNMSTEVEAHFVLVGRGDEFDLVHQSIESEKLKNLTLLKAISQEEYKVMLSEFDVGLFSLHKGHTTHNFPGKLLAYMVQGIPILGSINFGNDLKEVIENYDAGFVLVNGDDDKLLASAKALLNEERRQFMGKNSKRLLKDVFSVEAAVSKISKFHEKSIDKGV